MTYSLPHRTLVAGAMLAMATAWAPPVAAQNIYRSVGADGRVTFSDRAPPAAAAAAATAAAAAGAAAAGVSRSSATPDNDLPYALRQMQARYPVALYSADNCSPCSSARALLVARGIPFTEYTVETDADVQALQALSSQNQLPFATIGRQHLTGFAADEWRQYLDAAGYPAASQLPASYRRGAPSPLVAQVPATPGATPARRAAVAPSASPANRISPSNPAGLSF